MNHLLAVKVTAADNDSADLKLQSIVLAERLQLPLLSSNDEAYPDYEMVLNLSATGLCIESTDKKAPVKVRVDFDAGALNYRVRDAANSQAIAKAVGVKPGLSLSVLDGTAGFGKDAYLLATLGCEVSMLERNQIVHALLEDGLSRARQSHHSATRCNVQRMHLEERQDFSSQLDLPERSFDVVYLDPMFAKRRKTAKVKKEMLFLQKLLANVRNSEDDEVTLQFALKIARRRVVIKRARSAANFADRNPDFTLAGRTSRFDVYLVSD